MIFKVFSNQNHSIIFKWCNWETALAAPQFSFFRAVALPVLDALFQRALAIQFFKMCILKDVCSLAGKMGRKWSLCHWAGLVNSVGRDGWGHALVLSDSLAVGAVECRVLHVDWQTLLILSHTQAQPLKCRLDRQSWKICSFPSWWSSCARKGRVSGQALLCRQSPLGAVAPSPFRQWGWVGRPGTRPWGLARGKGGCDLHGLNFIMGT